MTTSRPRARSRIDFSFGPGHGPVSGVINAAAAICWVTMWMYLGDMSSAWGLVAGVAMAAAGVLVAAWYHQPSKVMVYRAGCWTVAGLWSFWVLVGFHGIRIWPTDLVILQAWSSPGSPWEIRPIIGLCIGAAVMAALGWSMQHAERRAEALAKLKVEQKAAEIAAAVEYAKPVNEQEEIAFLWEPFLRKMTKKELTVKGVKIWTPDYGFTLDIDLPADGTVLSDVQGFEDKIAAAAPGFDSGLPEGCGVEILANRSPGAGRRMVLIHVTTRSELGNDIPYPMDDLSIETIENEIAFAKSTNGLPVTIPLRYETAVLVGNTDSGKSNQINVTVAGLARCTDAVKVGIDVTGSGRAFRTWQRAYLDSRLAGDGKVKRPIFRYIAPNQHHARLLVNSLLQAIQWRTADYAEQMHQANSDKILVSPQLPELVLVVDEMGALDDDIKEGIAEIADTGRGAGVRVMVCALEATAQYLPGRIITQARVRAAMRVMDESQLQYLFDRTWKSGRFDPASMPWKGSGILTKGPKSATKFKGYRIEPAGVMHVATVCGDYQPEVDQPTLDRMDTVTIGVRNSDGIKEGVTFHNVWTDAERVTMPLIFPRIGGIAEALGTEPSSNTTITETEKPVSSSPGTIQDSFKDISAALGGLDQAMARLEAEANAADQASAGETPAAGDGDEQGDEDGDPEPPTRAALPSTEQLEAMWNQSTFDPRIAAQPAEQPDPSQPTADPAPPAGPITWNHTAGRPSPQRYALRVIHQAGPAGIAPGDVHKQMLADGYTTNYSTLQGWLTKWVATNKVDQPGGERTPYVAGPGLDLGKDL